MLNSFFDVSDPTYSNGYSHRIRTHFTTLHQTTVKISNEKLHLQRQFPYQDEKSILYFSFDLKKKYFHLKILKHSSRK